VFRELSSCRSSAAREMPIVFHRFHFRSNFHACTSSWTERGLANKVAASIADELHGKTPQRWERLGGRVDFGVLPVPRASAHRLSSARDAGSGRRAIAKTILTSSPIVRLSRYPENNPGFVPMALVCIRKASIDPVLANKRRTLVLWPDL
jgi:hypothetical protein